MSIERPRTIVTADPELDDLNSMIRFLLYSNEVDVAGLVYASSQFHWRGDGRGTTFFHPDREYTEPQASWRWAEGERFIDDAIDAYEKVHANLMVHDARYPTAAALRAVVRVGNVDFEGDTSVPSPGSDLIADVLLDDDPRQVFVQLWAGPSTLARALMTIEERFADTDAWPGIRDAVSAKTVVTKFWSQDATYDEYIAVRWPGIAVIEAATMAWGYTARRSIDPADFELLSAEWLRENVTSAGPLGGLYRVWGDGIQMVPGDPTDFFHLSGRTADELRTMGYKVWMDPEAKGEWISEGDTTNMLNVIVPSLRSHEHPSYGGWGGRAVRTDAGENTWVLEGIAFGSPDSDETTVTRWFADAQHDFAARLRWSGASGYADANHHPIIDEIADRDVEPGAEVALRAAVSDPDGDAVATRWWILDEASSASATVESNGIDAVVRVSLDATPGETVHVIVEAIDDAPHPMKAYRRVILTVV